jgi:hypothetical protein
MHALLNVDNNMEMYKNIYEGQRVIRQRFADQLNPAASNYQILNSDWLNNVVKHHGDISSHINDLYNANLR